MMTQEKQKKSMTERSLIHKYSKKALRMTALQMLKLFQSKRIEEAK